MTNAPFLYTRATLQKYIQVHFGISKNLFDYHINKGHIAKPLTSLSPDVPDLFFNEEDVNKTVAFFANRERWQHVPKEKSRTVCSSAALT